MKRQTLAQLYEKIAPGLSEISFEEQEVMKQVFKRIIMYDYEETRIASGFGPLEEARTQFPDRYTREELEAQTAIKLQNLQNLWVLWVAEDEDPETPWPKVEDV